MHIRKSNIVGLVVAVLALLNSLVLAATTAMNSLVGFQLQGYVHDVLSRGELSEHLSYEEYASCLKAVHRYLVSGSEGNSVLLALGGVGFSFVFLLLAADRLRANLASSGVSSRTTGQSGSPSTP